MARSFHQEHSRIEERWWGWIANSLGKALLMPTNVDLWEQQDDENIMLALKSYTVVVSRQNLTSFVFIYS